MRHKGDPLSVAVFFYLHCPLQGIITAGLRRLFFAKLRMIDLLLNHTNHRLREGDEKSEQR